MPLPLTAPRKRVPPRHIVNQWILSLKVGAAPADRQAELFLELQEVLLGTMLPQARRRFATNATDLAARAAAKAIDDVRSCFMCLDTAAHERNLLTYVVQQANLKDALQRAVEGTRSGAWPEWMTIVLQVLMLSRTSWTYLWLYPQRDMSRGYLGRLAHRYLRLANPQPVLTGFRGKQDLMRIDLESAYDAIRNVKDPLVTLLLRVNKVALHSANLALPQRIETVLNCIWTNIGSVAGSNRFTCLDQALRHAKSVLQPLPLQKVAGAVEELLVQTRASIPGKLIGSNIHDVLTALPPDHGHEYPVADVLQALDDIIPAPVVVPAPDWRRLSPQELRGGMYSQLIRSGATIHWVRLQVFLALVACYSPAKLTSMVQRFLRMPNLGLDPAELTRRGWVSDLVAVLRWWRQLRTKWETDAGLTRQAEDDPDESSGGEGDRGPEFDSRKDDPTSAWHFLELPVCVRHSPHQLDAAIKLLSSWMAEPAQAPADWSGVPDEIQQLVASALLDLIWDDLVSHMMACYAGAGPARPEIGA